MFSAAILHEELLLFTNEELEKKLKKLRAEVKILEQCDANAAYDAAVIEKHLHAQDLISLAQTSSPEELNKPVSTPVTPKLPVATPPSLNYMAAYFNNRRQALAAAPSVAPETTLSLTKN